MTRLGLLIRRLAFAGVAMMVLLACVSAYLRLTAAGVGCVPWPACYQQQPAAAERQHQPVARLAHRVLASTLGVVVVMIAFTSVSVRPRRRVVVWTAFGSLALTAMLAGLGSVMSTASAPGVALANLLGGMALAALLCWVALHAGGDSAPTRSKSNGLAMGVFVLVLFQLLLGALISTTHAGPACPLPLCVPTADDLPKILHLAHRVLAIAMLAAVSVLAATLTRRGDHAARPARVLAVLLLVQAASGVVMVALDFPLWLALTHNLGALLLLLAAVWVLAG